MYKNYYESAEDIYITRARAIVEVNRHGCNVDDFLNEVGRKGTYQAQEVLEWLGY